MNWKLIFRLSLFALAMGLATVFAIPPRIEPLCWLVIICICAYLIARSTRHGQFWHGLMLGLVNCVWVTGAHLIFFDRYVAGHAEEAARIQAAPLPPKLTMVLIGPVIGLISGIVIGLFAFVAAKFVKPRPVSAADERG